MDIIVTSKSQLKELIEDSTSKAVAQAFKLIEKRESKNVNYTVEEAAERLRVSKQTIRNYISDGLIEAKKVKRRVLINKHYLEENLEVIKSKKHKR